MKKSVAVLGLGKFGRSLSESLYQLGADVLAVDCDEELINILLEDKHDFDILKEQAPEAYKEMTELIFEWAYKYSIQQYGEPKVCILKEFPYQVYESLSS